MNEFSKAMRRARKEKGISIEELSQKTGYSVATLKKIENGCLIPEPEMVDMLNKELNFNSIESKCYLNSKNLDHNTASAKSYRNLCSFLAISLVISVLFMMTFYNSNGWLNRIYGYMNSMDSRTSFKSLGITQNLMFAIFVGLIGPSLSTFSTIRFLFDRNVEKNFRFYIFLSIGILVSVGLIIADILYFNSLKSLLNKLINSQTSWGK